MVHATDSIRGLIESVAWTIDSQGLILQLLGYPVWCFDGAEETQR